MIALRKLIKQTEPHLPHPIADFDSVKIIWADLPESWQACYFLSGTIKINRTLKHADPEYYAGVVCHELHHAHQHATRPVHFLLGKIIRPLIERSADEVERAADRYCGMGGLLDGDQ